jgi:polyvinyl alcohol dehydrogenase (cytochrome)
MRLTLVRLITTKGSVPNMNTNRTVLATVIALSALSLPGTASTQDATDGEAVFNGRCKSCHDPAIERAPAKTELAIRPRADIVKALTTGMMVPMAQGMSPAQIQAVAAYLTPAQAAAADAPRRAAMPPPVGTDRMCETHPPIRTGTGDWTSASVNAASYRFQPKPGIAAADLPKLKLKWAFTMSGGGQPTVVGDWLFTTNRSGKFYALDAKSGCVHWVVEGVSSRTTPMIVRSSISPSGWATFVGVGGRIVRAFDAQTGKEIWKSESLDPNPVAGITGSPIVVGNQIFVPLTSGEEGAAIQKTYPCCSFRGSLAALDLKTGKLQWQTYMITEPLRPTRKNADGVQMQGPAGAAIWAAPSVDEKRGLIYVVTGDSYTEVETKGADAVIAIEMKTGKVRWSTQVTEGDNYVMGCEKIYQSSNCPEPRGPDFDFGATPILFTAKNGKQVVVAGQKSGLVYGLNPDTGKLLWTTTVGTGSSLGGVEWGIGADPTYVFVPNADSVNLMREAQEATGIPVTAPSIGPGKPGLSAIEPLSGKVMWNVPTPVAPCKYAGDRSGDRAGGSCIRAQSAAPGIIPGVVFSGTLDGWMRGYDTKTGKIVWEYSSTAQTYDTVNDVKNQPGGSIDGMGPTIANGMLYFMSGHNGAARTGGNGNNVLLAFSVDGK